MSRIARIAFKVLFATDRSMAYDLREKMVESILAVLPPSYMRDKLHDTKEAGKGYSGGYVSFGLKPKDLDARGLIGGLLVAGVFNSQQVKSTAPERDDPEWQAWYDAGGNPDIAGITTTMTMAASYYHKKEGGSRNELLITNGIGDAEFAFDRFEGIHFFELMDPSLTANAITSLVDSVIRNPPEGSLSQDKKVQRKVSPFSSKLKAQKYLNDAGIYTISKKQVEEISRWTGELPYKIIEWFRKRGFSYNG